MERSVEAARDGVRVLGVLQTRLEEHAGDAWEAQREEPTLDYRGSDHANIS